MAKKSESTTITIGGVELPVDQGVHSVLELEQEADPARSNSGRKANPEANPFYSMLLRTLETGKSARVLVTPETCKAALRMIERAATSINRQLANNNEPGIGRRVRFRPADNPDGEPIDLGRHDEQYTKRDGTTGTKRVLNDPTEPVYIEFWARDRDEELPDADAGESDYADDGAELVNA